MAANAHSARSSRARGRLERIEKTMLDLLRSVKPDAVIAEAAH